MFSLLCQLRLWENNSTFIIWMTSNEGYHFIYKISKYSVCTTIDCFSRHPLSLFLYIKFIISANYLDQIKFQKKKTKNEFWNHERGKAKSSNILSYVLQKTVPITKELLHLLQAKLRKKDQQRKPNNYLDLRVSWYVEGCHCTSVVRNDYWLIPKLAWLKFLNSLSERGLFSQLP